MIKELEEAKVFHSLREGLMAIMETELHGQTTEKNIIAAIQRGVAEPYVLELQKRYKSMKRVVGVGDIFPDDILDAIRAYAPPQKAADAPDAQSSRA